MPQLVIRTRSGRIESVHDGYICITDSDGKIVYSVGDPNIKVFLRSTAKPFLAVALVQSGAMEKYNISLQELAVICSSHEGQTFHLRAVRSILHKIGLSEKDLECGHIHPGNQKVQDTLIKSGKRPGSIFNNCSGKHAGLLAICQYYEFPTEGYIKHDHPVQRLMKKTMAELLECDEKDIVTGTDGCTLPTYLLTLHQASRLYARLALGYRGKSKYSECLGAIQEAMKKYPRFVHGDDTFGTDLTRYSKGKAIGKIGAEGVFGITVPEKNLGIYLKLTDGHPLASYPAAVQVLKDLEILDKKTIKKLHKWAEPPVVDDKGNVVGYVYPAFSLLSHKAVQYQPGDIDPFGGKKP